MTARHRTPWLMLLVVIGIVVAACGGPSTPATSSATPAGVPPATAPFGVGPVAIEPLAIDAAADLNLALARQEADDRARARIQAGFAREVGRSR